MQTVEAMRHVVEKSGKTKRAVSRDMGKSDNYVASVIEQSQRKGGGVYSNTLASLATACGYILALVPAEGLPEGAVAIDPPKRNPAS